MEVSTLVRNWLGECWKAVRSTLKGNKNMNLSHPRNLKFLIPCPPVWRAAIGHLHRTFAHPHNETLARMPRRGNCPKELIAHVMKGECPECANRTKVKSSKVVAVPHAKHPNDGVAVDACSVTDNRTQTTKI